MRLHSTFYKINTHSLAMFKKIFLMSWLISSVGMFILSYIWHGYVLLDFFKNGTPSGLSLFYKILIYLVIGFIIAWLFSLKTFVEFLKYSPVLKGIIFGVLLGVIVFVISTFKSISYNVSLSHQYLLLNFFWQLFEQAMGGFIVGVVYYFMFNPEIASEENN